MSGIGGVLGVGKEHAANIVEVADGTIDVSFKAASRRRKAAPFRIPVSSLFVPFAPDTLSAPKICCSFG